MPPPIEAAPIEAVLPRASAQLITVNLLVIALSVPFASLGAVALLVTVGKASLLSTGRLLDAFVLLLFLAFGPIVAISAYRAAFRASGRGASVVTRTASFGCQLLTSLAGSVLALSLLLAVAAGFASWPMWCTALVSACGALFAFAVARLNGQRGEQLQAWRQVNVGAPRGAAFPLIDLFVLVLYAACVLSFYRWVQTLPDLLPLL